MKKKVKNSVSYLLIVVMLLSIYQPYNIYATEADQSVQVEDTQTETYVSESLPAKEEKSEQIENAQTPVNGEKAADNDSVDTKVEEVSVIKIVSFQENEMFQNPVYVDGGTSLDGIVATFPENVIAFDDKENEIEIPNVEWVCESDIGEEWSELVYSFELPETYVLGEDVQLPTISVCKAENEASLLSEDEGNATEVEDGTEAHPYLIYTYDDFEKVRQHLESGNYFKLMNDIDAENVEWKEIGTSSSNYFCATFDGNGHCIYNLEKVPYGIFGWINGAKIENLGLKTKQDVLVDCAGLICVEGINSVINKCYVIGMVGSENTQRKNTGMLAGNFSGDISECYTQGYVYGHYGNECSVGGIIGQGNAVIMNCMSCVKVEIFIADGDCWAGGISGSGKSQITNCLFLGEVCERVWDNKMTGQIYGYRKSGDTEVLNSYFSSMNAYDISKEIYGEGKTSGELREKNTYKNWDFENIWTMDEQNTGFPILKCMMNVQKDISTYEKPTCVGYSGGQKQTAISTYIEFSAFYDRKIDAIQNNGVYFSDQSTGQRIICNYEVKNDNELYITSSESFVKGHEYKLTINDNCIVDDAFPNLYGDEPKELNVKVCTQILEGKGTEQEPYVITNAKQLNCVYYQPTKAYILANDIDASEVQDIHSIGRSTRALIDSYPQECFQSGGEADPFSGIFDGQGYTISGIKKYTGNWITGSPQKHYIGLFTCTENATIKNLNLILADDFYKYNQKETILGTTKFFERVAGLVAKGTGIISNCTVNGNICTNQYTGATGLLAAEFDGIIQNCATYGSVTNGYNASGYSAGGLVGKLGATGTIKDCYSMAAVYGAEKNTVGGLVGINKGLIANTYVAGYVSKQQNAGGLVGSNTGNVHNSYYDCVSTGMVDRGKGTSKITSAMKSKATYEGWDFDNCWEINSGKNGGYPYLKGGLSIDTVFGTPTTIAVFDGEDRTRIIDKPCITIYENGIEVDKYTGDENGVITLDGIVVSRTYDIKITAEGYGVYTNGMYQMKAFGTQFVLLYPQTDTPTVYCANIAPASAPSEITDIMQKKKTITKSDTQKYNLEVSATYSGEIDQVCLIQDGKVIKISHDGRFEGLTGKDFESNKPLYIKAVGKDGSISKLYRTYLLAASKPAVSGSLGFGKLSVDVPDDIPILGGYTIELNDIFKDLKVFEVEVSDEKAKFSVNLEAKADTEKKEDKKDDKKDEKSNPTYDEILELLEYDKGEGQKNYISKLQQFVDDYNELFCNTGNFMTLDSADASKSTIKAKVFGYLEWDLPTKKICGGKIAIYISSALSFENGFVAGGMPFVIVIDLSGDAEGYATATLFTEQEIWNVGIDAKAKLSVGVGVGVPQLASIIVNGSGELETVIDYNTYTKDSNVKLDLTAELGWKLKILCYEMNKSWIEKTYHLYDSNDIQTMALADTYNIDEMQEMALSVNPITTEAAWNDSENLTRAAGTASDVTLLNNVYDNAAPQIVQAGNDLIMIYMHQNDSRTAINATELMYSVYDARRNVWQTPKVITNDMTADFYPSVVQKDGTAYVTWLNMSENVQNDSMDINTFASLGKISVAKYNAVSKKFEICTSDEKGMFMNPQLCADSGVLLWVVNTSADMLDNSKTDLLIANYDGNTISNAKTIEQTVSNLIMTKIGLNESATEIAYIYDCDGNYETTDDHILKVIDVNGNLLFESVKGAISDVEFANLAGENTITYAQNGTIYSLKNYKPVKVLDGNMAIMNEYSIENGQTDYIVFKNETSDTSIYAYVYDKLTGYWNNAIPLTDAGIQVVSYSAAEYNGDLRLAYQNIVSEQDGTLKAELHAKTIESTVDLEVSNISYDESTGRLDITVDVTNKGMQKADGYQIEVYDGSTLIFSEIKDETIDVGQSIGYAKEIETANILGYKKNFDVKVVPVNAIDADETDNVAEITVGYPDICMEIQDETIGSDTYYGNLRISNIGNYATDGNVNIYIYDTLVKTIPVAQLQVEEIVDLPVEVDMNQADIQDNVGIVKFEFVSNLDEMYLHNNLVTSNIYPSMNATLGAVHAADVNLSAGKTAELNVDFEAATGSKNRIAIEPMEYSVKNPEIATVDENGIVHGNKAGTTSVSITAQDSFGNVAIGTCAVNVTVEDKKEDTDGNPSDNKPSDDKLQDDGNKKNDISKDETSTSETAKIGSTTEKSNSDSEKLSQSNDLYTKPSQDDAEVHIVGNAIDAAKIQDKAGNAKTENIYSENGDSNSEQSEVLENAAEDDSSQETESQESDKNKTNETVENSKIGKKNIVLLIWGIVLVAVAGGIGIILIRRKKR